MTAPSLAIIGAGFSAVSLLRQLCDAQTAIGHISLYDSTDTWGTGLAYGSAAANALLNTRASDLGASPDNTTEFADWLGFTGADRSRFLPRKLYGHYLRDVLAELSRRNDVAITRHPVRVDALEKTAHGFIVHADGRQQDFEYVVLATGPLPAASLGLISESVRQHRGYVDNPWQPGWIGHVTPSARIAILGTGLSMIDHVQRLRDGGVTGPIVAISRHGLLPRVHLPQPGPAAVLSARLHAAITSGNLRELLRALRAEAASAASWQSVFDALRPQITTIWQHLDAAARRTFLRHLRSYWEVHRHRMAPSLHAEISAWLDSGRLQITAATIRNITASGDAIDIRLHPRGSDGEQTLLVDWLLRATGIDGPLVAGADSLYDSLLRQNLVQADALGLGLVVDSRQRVIAADGQPVPGLFALGAMARGRLWESTAIPELRQDARRLAHALASQPLASEALSNKA